MNNQTILYIVSDVRSGSTLLENILSKSKEVISVGELHHLDSYINKGVWGSKGGHWLCSCGESFDDCKFWKSIYKELGINSPQSITKTEIIRPKKKNEIGYHDNEQTIDLINNIYKAVFSVTNCRIIVDSSKEAYQGIEMYKNSPFKFKFVHLKRDMRAVVISKNKWNRKFYGKEVNLNKLLLGALQKRIKYNKLLRGARKEDIYELTYEELCSNLQVELNKIAEFVGFKSYAVPEYMELIDDHTVGGTPNKFQKRKIQYDDKWRSTARKKPFFNTLGYILNKIG